MNPEEETTTRVTRGALRRRSTDQDTAAGASTPKKPIAGKKAAILNTIQEKPNTPNTPANDQNTSTTESVKNRKDTPAITVTTSKTSGTRLRSRTTSLTEENLAMWDELQETRRTPRRRPSQDVTPQTAPQGNRRTTRRNSVTSEDAQNVTPIASRSRLSVAPPTIAEDDEKEDKINNSNLEADLSDLDIRKLRNRSISHSPVLRTSPSIKNMSINSQSQTEETFTTPKQAKVLLKDIGEKSSPSKATPKNDEQDEIAAGQSNTSLQIDSVGRESNANTTQTDSGKQGAKNVTFDEKTTLEWQNQSAYPKTPITTGDRKSLRLAGSAGKASPQLQEVTKATPEMFEIAETDSDSPSKAKSATIVDVDSASESAVEPQQLDQSVDASLANIVEDVRENLNQADVSMSILDTPRPLDKPKSRLLQLREVSCSTPLSTAPAQNSTEKTDDKETNNSSLSNSLSKVATPDKGTEEQRNDKEVKQLNESLKRKSLDASRIDEEEAAERIVDTPRPVDKPKSRLLQLREVSCSTPPSSVVASAVESVTETAEKQKTVSSPSKAWSQAVKGSTTDKGIDVFSVRKQEEEQRKDEEVEKLNESLKRKSLDASEKGKAESEEEEEEDESDRNSFVEDEAMEVNGYQSGDSLDSETRAEIDENAIDEKGESIGSDSYGDSEAEENEKNSFIATDEDEHSLLEGSGDDLDDEPVKAVKKKRSRIIQQDDSSDEEGNNLNEENESVDNTDKPENVSIVEINSSTDHSKNLSVLSSKSPEKSPKKIDAKVARQQSSPEKKRNDALIIGDEAPKSRKSLPAPALISADFYASSRRRNTINAMAPEEDEPVAEPEQKPSKRKSIPGVVANPAALILAKKNKRLTLEPTSTNEASKPDKRLSLPGELAQDKEISFLSKKKSRKSTTDESSKQQDDNELESTVEPMEVDEYEEPDEEQQSEDEEKSIKIIKKKPKDLSEFDHDAILSRCNEIVRADKEKRKQTATLRQKKKDEKRRQREKQQMEESTDANDESLEQSKKKKKKKKKQINYLLEELGETKEDQVAKALQRKMALLEAKKLRKKAKKAAKLQRQLNKENQENGQPKEGIGAKFEKKAKKKKDLASKVMDLVVSPTPAEPKVKLMVSARTVYAAQIAELKKDQKLGKKRNKQLKEKNHQRSAAAEEVQKALETESTNGQNSKQSKASSETQTVARVEGTIVGANNDENNEKPKKKKKSEHSEDSVQENNVAEEATEKPHHTVETPLKPNNSDPLKAPIELDEQLAKLKASLSEPIRKVVKKQKLSQKEFAPIQQIADVEVTPPRKITGGNRLKMLSRLESGGFVEEPMTPEQQLLKRNHGFREEPVTPKPLGFRVSSIFPAGQEELRSQADAAKKMKKHFQSNRIRPENVVEPVKTLPLPIWTRSGTFEVEDIGESCKKSSGPKSRSIPLKAGSGKVATAFMVKSLPAVRQDDTNGTRKLPSRQSEQADVEQGVYNFKKRALLAKTAHLREKKPKH